MPEMNKGGRKLKRTLAALALLAWAALALLHPLAHQHDADGGAAEEHCVACAALHTVSAPLASPPLVPPLPRLPEPAPQPESRAVPGYLPSDVSPRAPPAYLS